jgi:hypothetical protein
VTAFAARRRRSTWVGVVLLVLGIGTLVALTSLGIATLANSEAGRAAGDDLTVVTLPETPAALLGVVDDAGRLTSVVSLVLDPSGVGGSIVSIAAIADSSLGLGTDRLPLAETLELFGPEAFRTEAEALTGISYDVVELADAARVASLIAPLGELKVELPIDVIDDDAAEPVAVAGTTRVRADEAAAILTAFTASRSDIESEPARDAVWSAVASRVGAGIGSGLPFEFGAAVPRYSTLDPLVDQLFGGTVGWRNVRYVPPVENPRGVDVVVPDRSELVLVFAQIAPGRLGAPNPSLTFRIEATFSDDELAELGLTNADIAYDVIERLLFVNANVVSVSTEAADGGAPDLTQVEVADAAVVQTIEDSYPVVFGELEVVTPTTRIAGVDAVVVLGDSYLDLLDAAPPSTLPADDASAGGVEE